MYVLIITVPSYLFSLARESCTFGCQIIQLKQKDWRCWYSLPNSKTSLLGNKKWPWIPSEWGWPRTHMLIFWADAFTTKLRIWTDITLKTFGTLLKLWRASCAKIQTLWNVWKVAETLQKWYLRYCFGQFHFWSHLHRDNTQEQDWDACWGWIWSQDWI